MRLALISDIHANLPALEAALAQVDSTGVDEIWCLGDVVGYGAQPDGCAELVRERCTKALIGNHDLAVLGELDVSTFSTPAAEAVRWTRENADPATIEYLRGLDPADESTELGIYHASPRDPVWEYVLWPDQAAECLASQRRRVSAVGHSHIALFFTIRLPEGDAKAPEEALGAQAAAGTVIDVSGDRWLVNPGSVGQPRDGDPRASWLELDTETWRVTYHRTSYDVDAAAAAIEAAGLPGHLARRLHVGQ